ncbi:MAG: hypothetical protein HY831_05185 [Candidatus Aenigmarchaeota archaeon]|nr:hypothetical protein [Candidatus Aenigmarchaeota archaeon]
MNNYWKEIGIGFVIVIIAITALILFYNPVKSEEGFTEPFCLSLLSSHEAKVNSTELQSVRNGEQLFKSGIYTEENNTLEIRLEANRYEGIVEQCTLTQASTKPRLYSNEQSEQARSAQMNKASAKVYNFQCKYGELRMNYGSSDKYKYIFQEFRIPKDKNALVLKDFLNQSKLADFNNYTGQTIDLYQTSYTYVNPDLPELYADQLDGFIDGARFLGCQAELPQDFIEQSNYQPKLTVTIPEKS